MAYGIFILIILSTTIIPNSEIKNQEKNSAPFQMRFFWEIIFNKNFLGYASFMMASNATYFSFVATAPFLFKKFGYSGPMVGYSLCAASFPYMFSSFLGRKLSLQRTNLQIIFIGITLNVLGGLVLTSLFFLNWQHLLALMIPVFIITIGNGLLMPFCSANAIALFPQSAGLVTGILGAAQLAASAVATALMGIFENGTLLPFTLLVLGVSGYALTYFLSHFGHQNALSLKKK
jgi:DHA1 family bicyclomycin/chloramphenicol resistance-like MFS transporter